MSVLFDIGTLRNNWPMSVHASHAFSSSTVPIPGDYAIFAPGLGLGYG